MILSERIKELIDVLVTSIKSKLDRTDMENFSKDIFIYGINTNPFPDPKDLEEGRLQGWAQIDKLKLDYLATKQSIRKYRGDELVFKYLDAVMNIGELTTEEKLRYNKLLYRYDFIIKVEEEANVYIDEIAAATTIEAINVIVTNAVFTAVWGDELNE